MQINRSLSIGNPSNSIIQNKICLKFKCKLFITCTRRGTRQDPPKKVTTRHCAVDITISDIIVAILASPEAGGGNCLPSVLAS